MSHVPTKTQVAEARVQQAQNGTLDAPADGERRCVHCLAAVTLIPVPNAQPHHQQEAWSDGHPRYPFYCPKALNLTHAVLDVTA